MSYVISYVSQLEAITAELRRIADALEQQNAKPRYTMELQPRTIHPAEVRELKSPGEGR